MSIKIPHVTKSSLLSLQFFLAVVIGLCIYTTTQAQNFYISGGNDFSTALCLDGKVLVWGNGSRGRLGPGTTNSNTPIPITIPSEIKQVDAGSGGFGIAVGCEGEVWVWGELGGANGTPKEMVGPDGSQLMTNVSYVNAATNTAFAILSTGEVVAWGNGENGELGNGTTGFSPVPVYVKISSTTNLTGAIQVEGGDYSGFALVDPDGNGVGTVYSWGTAEVGTIGRGVVGNSNLFAGAVIRGDNLLPLDNIVSISAGDTHCMALDSDGNVWSWGNNTWQGQVGIGANVEAPRAVKVVAGQTRDKGDNFLSNVVSICAGQSFSMAVLRTGEVVAWGGIVGAALPNFITKNETTPSADGKVFSPVYLTEANGDRVKDVRAVSDGDFWAFLIKNNGDLFSIGYGPYGELGVGAITNTPSPLRLTLPECGVPTPCPLAALGPDRKKCPTDVVNLYAGSTNRSYFYRWYINGTQITSGTGALSSTFSKDSLGIYKVVITSPDFATCDKPCPADSDEVFISPILPPNAPRATYCNGSISPDYTGLPTGSEYQWWTTQQIGTGTQLPGPPPTPLGTNARSLAYTASQLTKTGTDANGKDIYAVYAEDRTITKTTVGPTNTYLTPLNCDSAVQSNQILQKFNVYNQFSLDTLSLTYNGFNSAFNGSIAIYSTNPNVTPPAIRPTPVFTKSFTFPISTTFRDSVIAVGYQFPAPTSGGQEYWLAIQGDAKTVRYLKGCAASSYKDIATNGSLVSIEGGTINGNVLPATDFGITYNWKISAKTIYPCGRLPIEVREFCPACTKPTSFAFTSTARSVCNTTAASITLTAGTANPAAPADGTPYLYQWYKGTTAIAGQTTNTLTVTSDAALGSGTYSVRVGHKSVADGSGCYLDSIIALLFEDPIINNKIFQIDTICSLSVPLPLNKGTTPTGGTAPLAYQWQSATTAQGPYTNIAGATTQNFTPGPVAATTYYKRVVSSTGACTPNTSDSAIVVADPALDAGAIQSEPATVCQFGVPQLTELTPASGGRGAASFVYSWQIDSSLTAPDEWKDLLNADTTELTDGPRLEKLGNYQFRRIVTSGKCRDTSTVVVPTIPSMNPGLIAADQQLCFGLTPAGITSVSLASGGTGPAPKTYTYRWLTSTDGTTFTPVAGLTDPTGYTPGVLTSTTYIAREATAVGGTSQCDVGATLVTIEMYRPVNPGELKADTTVCAGSEITKESLIPYSGGALAKTYQWQQSPSGNANTWTNIATGGKAENIATGRLTATTYYRRLTENFCDTVASNVYTVTVLPVKVPRITTILPNGAVCELDQNVRFDADTVGAGTNGRFEWYLDGVLQPQSTADSIRLSGWKPPVANVRVKVIPDRSTYPCYAADDDSTLALQVTQKLTPTVTLSDAAPICEGAPVTLTATTTPSSATDRLIWKVDGAVVAANAGGLSYTSNAFRNGQVVSVEFTSGSACAITPNAVPATRMVTVYEQPVATTDPNEAATICLGDNFTLTANGSFSSVASGVTYTWFRNGVQLPNASGVSYPAREQGTYKVVITNGGICKDTSADVPLQVEQIEVSAGSDRTMFLGDPAITLEGSLQLNKSQVTNPQTYNITWIASPFDSSFVLDASNLKPSVGPSKPTVYTVRATSQAGCSDSDQVVVTVYLPIRVPNAFSPNGDGLNDTWIIDGLASYPKAKVQVFNRWGTVVFESTGYPPKSATGWDGKRNGIVVPLATYYYVVDPNVDKEPVRTGYLVIIQ